MTMSESVGFRLREFRYPEDYEAVKELWNTAGPGVHLGRSDSPEEIQKKLQRDPELFLLAEAGGNVIGTVLGGFDGRRGIIYHLAVNQAYRQQGIGEALMDEVELRMVAKGCLRSYLLVTHDNLGAQHFYEKRGWEKMPLYVYGKDLVERLETTE
jgi:ribosomal protein S18 acetylase RimI-like enzyme